MDIKFFYKWAEAVSLILTPWAMHMCVEVFIAWCSQAWQWIKGNRRPVFWIAMGLCTHALGSFTDNGYWGHAWDWKLKEQSTWPFWFNNGVWPNILFRQLCTGFGYYCYMRGTYLYIKKGTKGLHLRMLLSLMIGVIYVLGTTPQLFE